MDLWGGSLCVGNVFFSPNRSTGLTWLPSQPWQDFKDSKVSMERQRKWNCSRALRMKTKTGEATARGPRPAKWCPWVRVCGFAEGGLSI